MEDTPQEIIEERHNSSRRDFLKKSAVTGAVVWSAPAIHTLSSQAWGQNAGYEPPCECDEEAFALSARATGIVSGTVGPISESGEAPDSASVADLNVLGGLVQTGLLTSETTECHAEAEVLSLVVDLGTLGVAGVTTVITARVLTATANGETCEGTSSIVELAITGVNQDTIDAAIQAGPNSVINLPLGLGTVTINEQNTNGFIEVNALHVELNVLDVQTLDLIVSHAKTTCC